MSVWVHKIFVLSVLLQYLCFDTHFAKCSCKISPTHISYTKPKTIRIYFRKKVKKIANSNEPDQTADAV